MIQLNQNSFPNAEAARIWLEEKLKEKVGFFVMLQESDEDEEFNVSLHTDNEEDCTEEQLAILKSHGLVMYDEAASHINLLKLIEVEKVSYKAI